MVLVKRYIVLWFIQILITPLIAGQYHLSGSLIKWHPVTIRFQGPEAAELDTDPNPFMDYRLNITFSGPKGEQVLVPGYFNGDGKGGNSGNCWEVQFTPDEAGIWTFTASFRKGLQIAVSLEPDAGTPVFFDGAEGDFKIREKDENSPGFLRWGRLEYADTYYLKFRDGSYWIKGGTDGPEDLLAYEDFDNTRSGSRFLVKSYRNHVRDWRRGDPEWDGGKGKGLIGALNYLSEQHVNSVYFLPMNIGGDGKNVWPFAGKINPDGDIANDNLHFDLGKLRQWEIVFAHAQKKGIVLHFVLNEAEEANKSELGGGFLTEERKLFYREMVSRFGHHNALIWNLCEEYNIHLPLMPDQVKQFAAYLNQIDPYHHPITVHHAGNAMAKWIDFMGDTLFSITSIQIGNADIVPVIENFRAMTAKKGRPLPISIDEFTVTTSGKEWHPLNDPDLLRKEKLWPAYLSGGQVEFILEGLLDVQDFRPHETLWKYTWYARKFIEENLPFWEMKPRDRLLSNESWYRGVTCAHEGRVFAKEGEIYAIYLSNAERCGDLNLSNASGDFLLKWYNPRTGLFEKQEKVVQGGQTVDLGKAPQDVNEDWVILLIKNEG